MKKEDMIIIPRSLLKELLKANVAADIAFKSITAEEKRHFLWDSKKMTGFFDKMGTLLFWSEKIADKTKSPLHIVKTLP